MPEIRYCQARKFTFSDGSKKKAQILMPKFNKLNLVPLKIDVISLQGDIKIIGKFGTGWIIFVVSDKREQRE